MPVYPDFSESPADTWSDISRNIYEAAKAKGFSGLEPNALDDMNTSMIKVAEYTAYLVENS